MLFGRRGRAIEEDRERVRGRTFCVLEEVGWTSEPPEGIQSSASSGCFITSVRIPQ